MSEIRRPKKWQVSWYTDPFWEDGTLAGKVEISDECYDSVCIMDEPQAEFFVLPNLEIVVDDVHDDDEGHWKGMPKYIERQIKREARLIFKAHNNEEFRAMMRTGKIKVENVL